MASLRPADPALGIAKADALEFLRSLPTESVDCIFTDPPYSSINKHRGGADSCRRMTELFPTIDMQTQPHFYRDLLDQFARVLRGNRHCYIMADEETMDIIKLELETREDESRWFHFDSEGRSELRYWKAIVWNKCVRGMGYHYANRHEFVLFFEKGKRSLNSLSLESIIEVPALRGKNEDGSDLYPTQKPVRLPELFIANSTMPGMTVLDCFAGSGSTAKAAMNLRRKFIGCDLFSGTAEFKR